MYVMKTLKWISCLFVIGTVIILAIVLSKLSSEKKVDNRVNNALKSHVFDSLYVDKCPSGPQDCKQSVETAGYNPYNCPCDKGLDWMCGVGGVYCLNPTDPDYCLDCTEMCQNDDNSLNLSCMEANCKNCKTN